MKKALIILFSILSIAAYSQAPTSIYWLKSRVDGSVPVPVAGWGSIYYDYISDKWKFCNGITCYDLPTSSGSGTFVGLTDGPGAFVATNYPRANAAGTALEWRTPAQVRSDIGAGTGSGTVTTATGSAPIVITSTPTTTPNVTITQATTSTNGYLSSTDWNTFNGKQNSITFGTGVLTAIGVNIGSAGAPVLFNGALGTPTSGSAANLTGAVVAGGGTGVGSLTAYAPLFGGTTSTGPVQSGTVGTAGQFLVSNGAGALPTFQTSCLSGASFTIVNDANFNFAITGSAFPLVNAATGTLTFVGTLAPGRGGTGLNIYAQGDLIYASAANVLSSLAKSTTATHVLTNTGTSNAPAWGQVPLSTAVSGDLPFANLTQGTARSVLGVAGNATADVGAIQATANQVLRGNTAGTGIGFGDIQTSVIVGTATNDAASAGYIGESSRANVSTYTNYTTTATYQNITSITLAAGDYELDAQFTFSSNSATVTAASDAIFVISTTTASAAGAVEGESIAYVPQAALLGTSHESGAIAPFRISLSGSTTYYLNTQATFTLGNPQYVGTIHARRVR
jgi:hypothetical protein